MPRFTIDPNHTEVAFKIKHLMISTVRGRFNEFSGSMESKSLSDFSGSKIDFECAVVSIDTGVKDRDDHLRSPDFFDVEKYPQMTFKSTSIVRVGDGYDVNGLLTICGVSAPLCLEAEFSGWDIDAEGVTKYGFDMEGQINRKDFGLSFQLYGGAGQMMLGEQVKIQISAQMVPS
jgi:polyisoprenoid-binding protein YceI